MGRTAVVVAGACAEAAGEYSPAMWPPQFWGRCLCRGCWGVRVLGFAVVMLSGGVDIAIAVVVIPVHVARVIA